MTTPRPVRTDDLLKQGLLERASRADEGLLEEVLRVVDITPQRRRRWDWPRLPDQWVPVLLAALLLAALAGALAIGQIKLPRPEVDLSPGRANGPIVVLSWTGQLLTAVDAEDPVNPDLELPAGSDLGDLSWAPDGQQMAYDEGGWIWIADVGDGTSTKLTPCAGQIYECTFAWSPDKSRLAVAHAGKLELVDPSDASTATIAEYPGNGSCSPLGRRTRRAWRSWSGRTTRQLSTSSIAMAQETSSSTTGVGTPSASGTPLGLPTAAPSRALGSRQPTG